MCHVLDHAINRSHFLRPHMLWPVAVLVQQPASVCTQTTAAANTNVCRAVFVCVCMYVCANFVCLVQIQVL